MALADSSRSSMRSQAVKFTGILLGLLFFAEAVVGRALFHQQPQKAVPRHGLGLGLPLCRAIAERHGGRIAVESVPQQGTRFTVSLPDRQLGAQVSDVSPLYDSGFNRPLLGLADALPAGAYTVRNQD